MAKIIVNGTIVQYPLGGMAQWMLAWLIGLKRLGHDVFFVEKSTWENSCYDLKKQIMSNNCSYGLAFLKSIFEKHELMSKWCFVDYNRVHYGLSESEVENVFKSADVFIDLEFGNWDLESKNIPIRIFFDGEPGWFQIKLHKEREKHIEPKKYDFYFTHGMNIGTPSCKIPDVGIRWIPMLPPVLINNTEIKKSYPDEPFSTVMNWQSHKEIEYKGKVFGQKDMEFKKFLELPKKIGESLVVAVSGPNVPRKDLKENGWEVLNADDIALSISTYNSFILRSKGEFSIMKNVFVENNTGAFPERAGYYLQYGRPVICQETGFSKHIPCGRGIFSVKNIEESVEAIGRINSEYERQAAWAQDIACEFFDAEKVLKKMLSRTGL